MMQDIEPIYCELCRLRCDECGHELGTPPNWRALEQEIPGLQKKIALGFLTIAAMIGANLAVFGGEGYVVVVAPVAWIIQSGYRHAILTKRLARRAVDRGGPYR